MEVTRNVILDLLPLYLADEASADTRALVEAYLETDPELDRLAQRMAEAEWPGDVPVPLTKEDEMEAYEKAKRYMFWRNLILAVTISSAFLCLLGFLAVALLFLTSA